MSGLDAPGFRIEIVGAVTDILHRPDGYAVIGDGNHAARGVGWECEGFASKILHLGILEDTGERLAGAPSRVPATYRFNKDRYDALKSKGFRLEF